MALIEPLGAAGNWGISFSSTLSTFPPWQGVRGGGDLSLGISGELGRDGDSGVRQVETAKTFGHCQQLQEPPERGK